MLQSNKQLITTILILLLIQVGLIYFWIKSEKTQEQTNIGMLFFGDLMLDRDIKTQIDQKGLSHLLEPLFDEKNSFFMNFDLIAANLEGPVTNNGAHYPPEAEIDFAFDPELVKQLKNNFNFNFFNIANNHIYDQGYQGLEETNQNLKNLDLYFSGCPDSIIEECTSTIIDIDNKKIGLAGFSMVYNPININEAQKHINNLKNQTDFIIVNAHWGQEYVHDFNTSQQNVAHSLIDAGADIIIGHHPHIVQGMEIYKNKPIFYSLGNFIFDQYFSTDTQQGLNVAIFLEKGDNIEVEYNILPIVINNDSQPALSEDIVKEEILDKIVKF